MKCILIYPPSPYLANDSAYPPSGLLYVAAAMEKLCWEVEIADLTGGIDWRKKVSMLQADLFGITCVTPNVGIVGEIANILRPKGSQIIVGGIHPTFLPEDTFKNIPCDAVVKGEAELVIKDLLNDVERGALKKIYEGRLVPVEAIPKPARHLIDLNKYTPGEEKTTPIYSSRGCPFDCKFCSRVTGRVYRVLPLDRVLEEIRDVMALGFKNIVFGDDDIAIQPKRLKEIVKLMLPLGLNFRLNQDARFIEGETLDLARRAGCREISFGIESGSQKMLNLMNKKNTVEANKRAILATKDHGMKAKAYFVVNFPGEDDSTVEETLKFAEETRPDKWLLSAFAPLPGSDTFTNPTAYGITWMSSNWEDYYLVGKEGSFKPCFTTEELSTQRQIYLHNKLYNGLKAILS